MKFQVCIKLFPIDSMYFCAARFPVSLSVVCTSIAQIALDAIIVQRRSPWIDREELHMHLSLHANIRVAICLAGMSSSGESKRAPP